MHFFYYCKNSGNVKKEICLQEYFDDLAKFPDMVKWDIILAGQEWLEFLIALGLIIGISEAFQSTT